MMYLNKETGTTCKHTWEPSSSKRESHKESSSTNQYKSIKSSSSKRESHKEHDKQSCVAEPTAMTNPTSNHNPGHNREKNKEDASEKPKDQTWLYLNGTWHKIKSKQNGTWNNMMDNVKKADEIIKQLREAKHNITDDYVVDHNVSDDEH